MKRRVVAFLVPVLCGLALLPLVNLLGRPARDELPKLGELYDMSFATRGLSWALYSFGISVVPEEVVIGREGWLYLGDHYAAALSAARRGQTPADLEQARRIGAAADAWERWLAARGVQLYRVLIGPDKGSIYPEYLPDWAQPAALSATDALLAAGGSHYVDPRAALRAAKTRLPHVLYHRTDTHWNMLGAGVAFAEFARSVGAAAPQLRWPSEAAQRLQSVVPDLPAGDLARMLHLQWWLREQQPKIAAEALPVQTAEYDFASGELLRSGGNRPVAQLLRPLRVQAQGALNDARVLWLRDSFGVALTPLMAATFSDVLQVPLHQAIAEGGLLADLTERWRPQFVFVTVVERNARLELFQSLPPQRAAQGHAPGAGSDPGAAVELDAGLTGMDASSRSAGLSR